MEWLYCVHSHNFLINYVTSEDTEAWKSLDYDDFLAYLLINKIEIKNYEGFVHKLQFIDIILYLDCLTGEWETQERKTDDVPFDELLKMNTPEEEEQFNNKDYLKGLIKSARGFLRNE